MKNLLIKYLQSRAKAVLNRFNPKIIAITGSMGKTSAKYAIEAALAQKVTLRTARKNYNNEIGVPLAILGEESPGMNIFGWVGLFWRSFQVKEFPEVLLLEFGADHPGDIKKLCKLATPVISVVTGISTVHIEYFKDLNALIDEKTDLVRCTEKEGVVFLNADDENVKGMKSAATAEVKLFGKSGQIYAKDIKIEFHKDDHFDADSTFVVTLATIFDEKGEVGKLYLDNFVGEVSVLASLGAISVARELGISTIEAIDNINTNLRPIEGRMRPIAGIKGTLIIDDTYNASPSAMKSGIETMKLFEPMESIDRRIAVLGQMAELGELSQSEHEAVGEISASSVDLLVLVGDGMKFAMSAAEKEGMSKDNIYYFDTAKEAGRWLDGFIKEGDIIYIKGSQSSRMEFVTKDLMAEPAKAFELLVRQDGKWLS